jgi:hypothetical protein
MEAMQCVMPPQLTRLTQKIVILWRVAAELHYLPFHLPSSEFRKLWIGLRKQIICIYKKGKAITLQTWTGPECTMKLRLPDFKTVST